DSSPVEWQARSASYMIVRAECLCRVKLTVAVASSSPIQLAAVGFPHLSRMSARSPERPAKESNGPRFNTVWCYAASQSQDLRLTQVLHGVRTPRASGDGREDRQ